MVCIALKLPVAVIARRSSVSGARRACDEQTGFRSGIDHISYMSTVEFGSVQFVFINLASAWLSQSTD